MEDDWPDKATFPRADTAGGLGSCRGAALEVSDPKGLVPPAELDRLTTWAAGAAAFLRTDGEVRVRLVDDVEMAAAHERYSGIAGTTDVLTFDLRDPEEAAAEPTRLDVDILACVDEARRQAAGRAHAVERELLLYILHGVLHCLGEDDHDDAAYARMHAREDEVLEAIGAGRVFAAPLRTAAAGGGGGGGGAEPQATGSTGEGAP
jgi:probable rRNA maturation factor